MPTLSSRAIASSRSCGRAGRQKPRTRPACESSAICTFSTTVSEAKVSAIWKVRPTPWRQIASGLQADQLAAAEPHRAGVGRELAADHVEAGRLAGAVRADQRQHLAGGERRSSRRRPRGCRRTPSTGRAPRAAPCDAAPARLTPLALALADEELLQPAGDAEREHQHQRQHDDAEQRPPVVGLARHRVLQPGEERAADPRARRPPARRRAAPSPGRRPTWRRRASRARSCPWRRRTATRPARRSCRRRRTPPTAGAARRGRSPRRGAANRGWRAGPGRTARAASARSRPHAGDGAGQHQQVVRRLRRQPRGRPDADQAVAAAGERVPLEHDRPDDLREGERQHRQVHARQAHAEPAEDEGAERRRAAARAGATPPSAGRAP